MFLFAAVGMCQPVSNYKSVIQQYFVKTDDECQHLETGENKLLQ